jgi:MtfA peptidase
MQVWPRASVGVHVAIAALLVAVVTAFVITSDRPLAWLALGPAVASLWLVVTLRRYFRRWRLLRRPMCDDWRAILRRRVPFYRALGEAGRCRFEDDLRIFLAEQRIYGAHGVQIDDETRVLIGASAAMLGHGLPDFEWPNVRDIVVYPGTFDEEYRTGPGRSSDRIISGMVHRQGPVLFSKQDLCHGFRRADDGHNVGLHELAHVMDMGTGYADGLPSGLSWVATAPWINVMADRLKRIRRRQYRHVLRDYAGVDEAELFAVAVEVFFERPEHLQARDPELYRMLVDYFGQDPARGPGQASA